MNTDTVKKESVKSDSSRKITDSYTIGDYRVKVSTWHDKNRKAYITSVSECQVQQRDGYSMEFHAVFADYYKTINATRVSRYSLKSLEVFHQSTAEEVAVIVAKLIDSHNKKEGE